MDDEDDEQYNDIELEVRNFNYILYFNELSTTAIITNRSAGVRRASVSWLSYRIYWSHILKLIG